MQIGITEAGDPALDKSWVNKLKDGNIIVTKNPKPIYTELLLAATDHKNVILHATVTGYGRTEIELNVPPPAMVVGEVRRLIENGFPAKNVVYRVDPIIPNGAFFTVSKKAIELGKRLTEYGVTRARYSFIDMYPHTKQRFTKAGFGELVKEYNDRFTIDAAKAKIFAAQVEELFHQAGFVIAESCGEYAGTRVGCVSEKDIEILGLNVNDIQSPEHIQRKSCNCIGNKVELLSSKKQCGHGCLYCYWRD